MKKPVALILCALSVFAFASCSYAQTQVTEDYLEYEVPKDLIVMRADNLDECAGVISDLGKTTEDVSTYLKNNMIKVTSFYQTKDAEGKIDYPYEYFITVANTSYSQNIFDFGRLSEEDLEYNKNYFVDVDTAKEQGYDVTDLKWIDSNGAKYIYYKYNVTDEASGINQYGEQYMTIYNGNIYCFSAISYEGTSEIFEGYRDEFFGSIKYTQKLEPTEPYDPEFNTLPHTLLRIWKENTLSIIGLVLVFAVMIAFIVYSVKNNKKTKPQKDGKVRADYLH